MAEYRLRFVDAARTEWNRLDGAVMAQFRKVLQRRLENPHVPAARLSGGTGLYRIKLRAAGFRLIYRVRDEELIVLVIAVGRRDEVYQIGMKRIRAFD